MSYYIPGMNNYWGKLTTKTILNVLLQNPNELNLKEKSSAIRENKLFTLDMREILISSAKADDNGAYISKGSAKRLFQYNSEGSRTVHRNENGAFYANVKTSKGYKKEYIPESEVYELTRYYKTSKFNPKFSRTIATVKAITSKELKPFCTNGQVEKVKSSFFRATGTPKSRPHRHIFAKTLAHLQP